MITLDKENDATVVTCETCSFQERTEKADGVVPGDWMTGHLWLDISLSEQKQIPICFCSSCKPHVQSTLYMGIAKPIDSETETLELEAPNMTPFGEV